MPSLSQFRTIHAPKGKTIGRKHKWESDTLMKYTWDLDEQSCVGYLYDYFHDSEYNTNDNLKPYNDPLKIPVDVKLIINAYNSDAKDQPSLHIQFKPDYKCNVPYYAQEFHKRYGAEFPIGLYIDLPDEEGVYRRWLITEPADIYNKSFKKYSVLPVNYKFQWIEDTGSVRYKREMWGVEKLRNSYNSGIWAEYLTRTIENQSQFLVPLNTVSEKLYYNQRLIVSAPVPTPNVWEVSKSENTKPIGINKITIYQTRFDPVADYVNLETKEMYADYYKSSIQPISSITANTDVSPDVPPVIKLNNGFLKATSYTLKVGGGYRNVTLYKSDDVNSEKLPINQNSVKVKLGNMDADELIEIKFPEDSPYLLKIKFLGTDKYLTEKINITVSDSENKYEAYTELEIVNL